MGSYENHERRVWSRLARTGYGRLATAKQRRKGFPHETAAHRRSWLNVRNYPFLMLTPTTDGKAMGAASVSGLVERRAGS